MNWFRMTTICQPSLTKQVNGLLYRLMGDTLAVHMNYTGRNNKVALFNTPFLRLLISKFFLLQNIRVIKMV